MAKGCNRFQKPLPDPVNNCEGCPNRHKKHWSLGPVYEDVDGTLIANCIEFAPKWKKKKLR